MLAAAAIRKHDMGDDSYGRDGSIAHASPRILMIPKLVMSYDATLIVMETAEGC